MEFSRLSSELQSRYFARLMARAMASTFLGLALLSFCNLAAAINDIEIDYNNLPIVGETYVLSWSNTQGKQVDLMGCSIHEVLTSSRTVRIDLDEISDPSGQVNAKAGLRVGRCDQPLQ